MPKHIILPLSKSMELIRMNILQKQESLILHLLSSISPSLQLVNSSRKHIKPWILEYASYQEPSHNLLIRLNRILCIHPHLILLMPISAQNISQSLILLPRIVKLNRHRTFRVDKIGDILLPHVDFPAVEVVSESVMKVVQGGVFELLKVVEVLLGG